MVHAMAKATYELRGDKLHLLKGHTLPASMVQATISIDEIDPIALCAKLNTEFSAELNTVNAPKLTAAVLVARLGDAVPRVRRSDTAGEWCQG